MTKRADQLHHDNAPDHSTSFVQFFFFCKASHHSGLSAPLPHPKSGSLRLLAFPKVKIAVAREEICEYDGQTVHKLSQRCLTADWLAQWKSDCSRMHSKVSSDWLPSYIKVTPPVLEILKIAGYFPDSPRTYHKKCNTISCPPCVKLWLTCDYSFLNKYKWCVKPQILI
jgi:hypothetical protein